MALMALRNESNGFCVNNGEKCIKCCLTEKMLLSLRTRTESIFCGCVPCVSMHLSEAGYLRLKVCVLCFLGLILGATGINCIYIYFLLTTPLKVQTQNKMYFISSLLDTGDSVNKLILSGFFLSYQLMQASETNLCSYSGFCF